MTNAFAMGLCNIQAIRGSDGHIYWQGILLPGEAGPTFTGASGETLQVVVNNDGTVELDWLSGSTRYQGYQLNVIPTYDMSFANLVQCSGFNLPQGVSGRASVSGGNPSSVIRLTGAGSSWTPDPANVTASGDNGFYVYEGIAS